MDPRELALAQQVENQLSIPPVILLATAGAAANLGRVADEELMTEPLRQLDEPGAVAAGPQPDDDLARELSVEAANVIAVVSSLSQADLPAGRVAVTNSLLTRVEVHTTIDSHGYLLRDLMRKVSLP